MNTPNTYQDLSAFKVPDGFRGRPAWVVQLWWLIQATAFKWSPQFAYGWRAMLLRLFGARVGKGVIIRPTAQFTYPWKISIGDYSWIGDQTVIYSLGSIDIGSHTVISQQSYVCAGDHDYASIAFDLRGPAIRIGNECWVASGTYIAPGVTIGDGCVVGARSVVVKDLPAGMLCVGMPCRAIRPRILP